MKRAMFLIVILILVVEISNVTADPNDPVNFAAPNLKAVKEA